jgi:hypothetical protein
MATQTADGSSRTDSRGVNQSVEAIKHDFADLGNAGINAAKEQFSGMGDMAREQYEAAKKTACEATQSARHVVSGNPLTAVAVAAGVGLLVGLLVARPRS